MRNFYNSELLVYFNLHVFLMKITSSYPTVNKNLNKHKSGSNGLIEYKIRK